MATRLRSALAKPFRGSFFRRFWANLIALSTIVALYVAAASVGLGWVFLAVVGASLVITGFRPIINLILRVADRYRRYPQLLQDFGAAYEREKQLQGEVRELRDRESSEYERGVAEGRSQTVGETLAKGMTDMPRLSALACVEGDVALVGSFDGQPRPIEGAWLQVEVIGTGEVKGAVLIHAVKESERLVIMKCCEKTVPEFWSKLAARVDSDAAAPQGVRLRPYVAAPESQESASVAGAEQGRMGR